MQLHGFILKLIIIVALDGLNNECQDITGWCWHSYEFTLLGKCSTKHINFSGQLFPADILSHGVYIRSVFQTLFMVMGNKLICIHDLNTFSLCDSYTFADDSVIQFTSVLASVCIANA